MYLLCETRTLKVLETTSIYDITNFKEQNQVQCSPIDHGRYITKCMRLTTRLRLPAYARREIFTQDSEYILSSFCLEQKRQDHHQATENKCNRSKSTSRLVKKTRFNQDVLLIPNEVACLL